MNKLLKKRCWVVICSIIHLILTTYSDNHFFEGPISAHFPTWIFLKVLLFVFLLFLWNSILSIANGSNLELRAIIIYALPYFCILVFYMLLKHNMYLVGDEYNIYSQVLKYNIFPYHFTYFTGLIYALSYMLIPCQMGIVFIKIILQALVCGYFIFRFKNIVGKKGYVVYLLFLLPPVIENGILVHRMHFYALLYVYIIMKILLDSYEKIKLSNKNLFLLLMFLGILTIWRKEGIYLLIIAPILLCCAYQIKDKRKYAIVCITWIAIFLCLYSPQLISGKKFTQEAGGTYLGWFVNMCREGLEIEKYPEQMKKIDKYVSLDAVEYINNELGDRNYEDVYIVWLEGYIGVRKDHSKQEYQEFTKAVQELILKEPTSFVKTRIKLWFYTAGKINFSSIREGCKSFLYNLNIPLLAIIVSFFIAIINRNWLLFWICGMTIAHCAVTLVFAPAAYFKYYYQLYLLGWMLIILFVLWCYKYFVHKNFNKTGTTFIGETGD